MGTKYIIGYDRELQGYFIYLRNEFLIVCDKCKNSVELNNFMAVHITQKQNQIIDSYFCLNCYKTMKPLANKVDIFCLAFLVSTIGKDYMVITDFEPFLKAGSITCWDIDKLEGHIIDKTIYSNKYPSIEGATIGIEIEDRYKDNEVKSVKQIDKFFNDRVRQE